MGTTQIRRGARNWVRGGLGRGWRRGGRWARFCMRFAARVPFWFMPLALAITVAVAVAIAVALAIVALGSIRRTGLARIACWALAVPSALVTCGSRGRA